MRLIVNSMLLNFLRNFVLWEFVLLNSDELCQSVMLIQKQTEQKSLKLCVKFSGKTSENLHPVKDLYFDDHHNSVVLVIDDPNTVISL